LTPRGGGKRLSGETDVDIASWLRGLGLERYEPVFRDSEIDAAVLPELTDEHLKELGLPLGPRLKLLKAVAALRAEPRSDASALSPVETGRAVAEGKGRSPPAVTSAEAERRQLTVLFCDLVGSTELATRLDPEDLREVIRAYQDACAGAIVRFEGHVAKFMGDGVLAYFGWPTAHEDDTERAVCSGLQAVRAVGALAPCAGAQLQARVGIATGLVVVGDLVGEGAAQEQAVVGETPNLAARLQSLAEPGGVVVAPATRRLLGGLFEYADLGVHRFKGFATPVRAWRVLGSARTEGRFEARSGPALPPMIGRDQELALLLERWTQAKAGEGQGVLLVGEAGIGKSRISRALLDALAEEPHARIRYQCSPYHSDSALWPVIQQLTFAAGIADDDPEEAKLDKLEALFHRSGEAAEAAPLIAGLLGLEGERRYGALDLTPQAQRARTLEALVGQLLHLAGAQPVLVLLEDAHWVDPTTLELIEQSLDRIADAPVLIVLTSRPDQQPQLAAHPHVTRLTLNRLGRAGAAAIIARLCGDRTLPTDVVATIIARSDGVPLFVEELTKAVLETGEASIPASLHDSLMARLDRVAGVKEVAQAAACIGREFDYALLAAVAGQGETELRAALDKLTLAELVFRRGTPPAARYTFKHALVQDTAYASLLRGRRQQLHARIGEVLERRFPERAAAEPDLLAHHFAEAGRLDRAVVYLTRAGERAVEASANVEAVRYLRRGLELIAGLPEGIERDRLELPLWLALAPPLVATRGYAAPDTLDAYARARELADRLGDTARLPPVVFGELAARYVGGQVPEMRELAKRFGAIAERDSRSGLHLVAWRMFALDLFHSGDLRRAKELLERLLAEHDHDRHHGLAVQYGHDPRGAPLAYLAWTLWHLGYPEQAANTSEAAVAWARELSHVNSKGITLCWGGILPDLLLRQPRSAETMAREVIRLSDEHRMLLWHAYARAYLGWAQLEQGDAAAGLEAIAGGIEDLRRTGTRRFVPSLLCARARAEAQAGPGGAALATIAEAFAELEATGDFAWKPELHRVRAALLLAEGARDEAVQDLLHALESARGQEAKSLELRAATDLARLWAERGTRRKADDLLAPVYGWFTEGFDLPDLQDAKALLDGLR
jgi:class 3 adenylate cyclase/predicted ATPase